MKEPARHPSLLLAAHRRWSLWFVGSALAQLVWACAVLVVAVQPLPSGVPSLHPWREAGIVYAAYSGMVAFFLVTGTFLSHFLNSRGWLRAVAFASAIPGFGVGFGILQCVPGALFYRALGTPEWSLFFQWRDRQARE